ncbi:hypothetical protein Q5752_004289 [Cryptotrichosporon argae]
MSTAPLTNVLSKSKSPYLLQHKDNPVAWQEFTPETIRLAKELDRPIFLSSGYSACHWCHVLAHESFEDADTAQLMNDYFVNIKVDREERPDVDRLYMAYLQASSGGGGWPLSVFMTPDLEPFFAGTYFPRQHFRSLLVRLRELWDDDRDKCVNMGRHVISMLAETSDSRTPPSLAHLISTNPLGRIFTHLTKTHDPRYHGHTASGARATGPKFPSVALTLEPLARLAVGGETDDVRARSRAMGVGMLRSIWKGGIRDWVGGGVARYSVDEKWIVPHFEKMLYDQAQLLSSAVDFGLIAAARGERADAQVCFDLAADIIKYSLRDLRSPLGGFFSAEDADSAPAPGATKKEGAFYVWDKHEIDEVVGDCKDVFDDVFSVKIDGNVPAQHDAHGEMTGKNILYQAKSYADVAAKHATSEDRVAELVQAGLAKLKERRDAARERPGLDDKILTAWNGLMLTALAKASVSLPETYGLRDECRAAADGIVAFIRKEMWDATTRSLTRSYRDGKGPTAQTDDYAFFIKGLLDLYEASGDDAHVGFALDLQQRQDELFWDADAGGYFASAPDPHVLVRMKDAQDAAEPSATSVTLHNLQRLALLASAQHDALARRAEETYGSLAAELEQVPRAFAYSACALVDFASGYREYVITGSGAAAQDIVDAVFAAYRPNKVVVRVDPARPPTTLAQVNEVVQALVEGGAREPALRVCENGACGLPVSGDEVARVVGA